MSSLSSHIVSTVVFPGFSPLRCLLDKDADVPLSGQDRFYAIVLDDGQRLLLPVATVERADGYSAERIYQAGLDMLALFANDRDIFGPCGFTPAWEGAYRSNLERMFRLWLDRQRREYHSDIGRRLGGSVASEAAELVRKVLLLAQPIGLRDFFEHLSGDLGSASGLRDALFEIRFKSEIKEVRARLRQIGVTDEMLRRVEELSEALHKGREAEARDAAEAARNLLPLRIAKGAALGDLLMVSSTARAQMRDSRFEPYQVGRLLDLALRAPSGRGPAPPPAPRAPEGGPPPAPPVASPPATSTKPVGPLGLAPGTLLSTTAPDGSQTVVAVVGADGAIARVGTTPPAPQPAAELARDAAPGERATCRAAPPPGRRPRRRKR